MVGCPPGAGGWLVRGWCVSKGFWFRVRHFRKEEAAVAFAVQLSEQFLEAGPE